MKLCTFCNESCLKTRTNSIYLSTGSSLSAISNFRVAFCDWERLDFNIQGVENVKKMLLSKQVYDN